MLDANYVYAWRCAKCSNHFANITQIEGIIRQEKKCPKCKSLNFITLGNKEIHIVCKFIHSEMKDFEEEYNGNYPYPI
jgi:phage FluMu protein Com